MTAPKPAFDVIEETLNYAIYNDEPSDETLHLLHTGLAALKEVRESVPDELDAFAGIGDSFVCEDSYSFRGEPISEWNDQIKAPFDAAKILHKANGGGA